jgi:cytochrome b pre-mRNA-processing protein 3
VSAQHRAFSGGCANTLRQGPAKIFGNGKGTTVLGLGRLFRGSPEKLAGRRLYAAAVAQARQPAFYAACGVPDTPTGRFDLIVLHAFLLLQRLKAEREGRALAQAFCDAVVEDMDRNLREMGIGDLSVGKKVKKLMQGFYGRLHAYETALADDDGGLVPALKRNIYGSGTPAQAQLDAMAAYVRREAGRLPQQSLASLRDGEPGFGPAPALQSAEKG